MVVKRCVLPPMHRTNDGQVNKLESCIK